MKSISTKLAVIFILIFLVIVTTVSAIIIIISSKSIKELTIQGISNRMEIQADGMQKMFLQRASVINMVAQIVMDEETIEQDYIQSVISPLYEERNEYNLYVGFEDDRAFFADYWEPESSWRATERDWYIEGKANPGKTISTVPYVDAQTGEVCITMVYGMVKDGKFIGVVALDVWQDDLLEPMQGNSAASDNQYAMLLDNAGNIYYHPNEELAPSVDGIKNLKEMDGGKYLPIFSLAAHNDYTLIRNYENKPSYYVTSDVEGTDWIVCGVILKSELEKEMNRQIWLTVLISFSMIVLSVIIVIYVVRKMITVPINHMLNAALVMATGDLDVEVDTHANDEMGEFGRAFQVIIENTKENVRAIKAIAEGDLTQCVKIGSDKDVMGISLTAMLDSNNEVMGEILAASRQVSACSQQIADVSQQLTSGSLEQSEAVDNLSSNVAEITSFTKDNMELSGNAVRLSAEIINNAERGGEQMSEMLDAVRKINEAARSIGHVIKTIDDIAFQTNILALNASVEAARAGQHGKGFAVVAEEVRNLATKSADAAKNTSELISDTMEKAELGSRLASETADSFERIVDGVRNSTEKIKEISTYSEKQVSAIEAIADELNNVSRVAQQNSASAEETAAAGSEMSSQSSTLQGLIGQFKIREGSSNYSPHSLGAQTPRTGFSVNHTKH